MVEERVDVSVRHAPACSDEGTEPSVPAWQVRERDDSESDENNSDNVRDVDAVTLRESQEDWIPAIVRRVESNDDYTEEDHDRCADLAQITQHLDGEFSWVARRV